MSEALDQEIKEELEADWTTEEALEAESMGWISPEKSENLPNGKKYLGPVEFMERNPLYKRVKQLESSFGELNTHYHNVAANEKQKAEKEYHDKIEKLKSEKVKALNDDDNQRVVDIDEEIRTSEKPVNKEFDQEFNKWKGQNSWFESDSELKEYADYIGPKYADEHPRMPYSQILEHVTKVVKKTFPGKFTNSNRSRPPSVEGDTPPARTAGKTMTEKDLTSDERQVFKNFVAMGIFPDEKDKNTYLKEVIELRGKKNG